MIKPLFTLVIVKPIEIEESNSLLILPQNLEDKKRYGIVCEKGGDVNPNINIGDKVLWFGECGERMEEEEIEYIIMNDRDLKAIV